MPGIVIFQVNFLIIPKLDPSLRNLNADKYYINELTAYHVPHLNIALANLNTSKRKPHGH